MAASPPAATWAVNAAKHQSPPGMPPTSCGRRNPGTPNQRTGPHESTQAGVPLVRGIGGQPARAAIGIGCHSVGSLPNCLDKGLPVRTWRPRGLCAAIRGPYQGKSDRVARQARRPARAPHLRVPGRLPHGKAVFESKKGTLRASFRRDSKKRFEAFPPLRSYRGVVQRPVGGLLVLAAAALHQQLNQRLPEERTIRGD